MLWELVELKYTGKNTKKVLEAEGLRMKKMRDLAINPRKGRKQGKAVRINLSNAGDVMLTLSSQNEGIRVTYCTPPTKDLLKSQTTALIAMMRG